MRYETLWVALNRSVQYHKEMDGASEALEKPWDAKQKQIIEGAQLVFSESGFEGASVNEIALRAGVSKATLYNHFPNKEELFGACIRARVGAFSQALVESARASRGSIEQDLTDIGERFMGINMDPQAIAFFRIVIAEALRQPTLAQHLYKKGPRANEEHLAGIMQRAVENGQLLLEDPLLAAQQFLSLCKCESEQRMLCGMTEGYSLAEMQNFVHKAVRTFMRAYGPR